MSTKKYKIGDIAQAIGVSPSTISKAMNNAPGVSDKMRKKILDYAEEIGYQPNFLAQSLSKGKINIIALILSDIRNPFYSDFAFHIQSQLNALGYMVMVFNHEYEAKKEAEFINFAIQASFSGVILFNSQCDIAKILTDSFIPTVVVNKYIANVDADFLLLDSFQGGYTATRHLIDLGHSKIAFAKGREISAAALQRYDGFIQAMKNYFLPVNESWIFHTDARLSTGYSIAQQIFTQFNQDTRPTAIVISNDVTSLGFISYCNENHIVLPKDISVVSFDNLEYSEIHGIDLTTMDPHIVEMGRHASELIASRIAEPTLASRRVTVEPTLITRSTSGSPLR